MQKYITLITLFLLGSCTTSSKNETRNIASKEQNFRMLNHRDKPEVVLLGLKKGSSQYAYDMAKILEKVNSKKTKENVIKLHLISGTHIDENTAKSLLQQHGDLDFKNLIFTQISKFSINKEGNAEENPDWFQDYGSYLYDKLENKKVLLDLNRSEAHSIFARKLQKEHDYKILYHNLEKGFENSDAGGNIEVTPNNILYTGTVSERLNSLFNKLGYKKENNNYIKLNTSFLNLGHIDEYISTIPIDPKKNNNCDFALVVSSPLKGSKLLKTLKEDSFEKHLDLFNSTDETATDPEFPSLTMVKRRFHFLKDKKMKKSVLKFEKLNQKLEKIISEETHKLRSAIDIESSSCKKRPVLKIPMLFSCGYYEAKNLEGEPFGCNTDIPNAVNLISLGRESIIPDTYIKEFNNSIKTEFLRVGHKVHFIEAIDYFEGNGGPHCSTAVIRKANF